MGRWKDKYVIGLTGNIAMGKSLVRRMLEHLGAYTIDADGLAHQAMAPGAPAYKPVIVTFGQWILDPEKRIDRTKLGAVAFSHPDALMKLEALTHPVVGQAIDTLIQRARQKVMVVEAIKLLEGQLAGPDGRDLGGGFRRRKAARTVDAARPRARRSVETHPRAKSAGRQDRPRQCR